MKGDREWIAGVDDSSLDFLATEISEQTLQELARRWAALFCVDTFGPAGNFYRADEYTQAQVGGNGSTTR